MKILFPIGTLYPSEQGGPSNTIYWMAKALATKNIEPICISTDLGLPHNSVENDKWLITDYGRVRYTSDKIHSLPFKLIYYSIKELRSVDVVHLTSIFYPPSWILASISVLFRKKIIWSVRGNLEKDAIKISTWKKKPIIFFINRVLKNKIIFHSTSLSETINTKQFFGQKSKFIQLPNYIELPLKMDRNPTMPYLLYIGRIHPIKALENIIDALNTDQFRQSLYYFYIVGDGDAKYIDLLKDKINQFSLNDKVLFLPHTTGIKKQQLYANAQFTFLVSHSENFGNVVLESMAQGTPVVTSKGTPWEDLDKNQIGYWVYNDSEILKIVVSQIVNLGDKEYQNIRKRSYEYVTQHFDIYHNVDKWIEVYK